MRAASGRGENAVSDGGTQDMRRPAVCVTVDAPTTAELRRRRDAVVGADLVELRLDDVRDLDVAGVLADRRTPVIVTCRPTWEGGAFEGTEEERRRILEAARAQGAEFVDIEWRAGFDELVRSERGRGIVLSMHDFEGVPRDLATRLDTMHATGAEVLKIAVHAHRLTDCLTLLDLRNAAPSSVLIAMGPSGFVTRVMPDRFGSRWTYAGHRTGCGAAVVRTTNGRISLPAGGGGE